MPVWILGAIIKMDENKLMRRVIKPAVFLSAMFPFVWLGSDALRGTLGFNPVEELTHRTGFWTLVLLIATLSVTPLMQVTGFGRLIRVRRMVGLFAFSYALSHLLVYVTLDRFFEFDTVLEDIAERPYITVGFACFLILLALAVTSTKGWIKRMGGKRWANLHSLIYLAAGGGVLHFLWLVKADTRRPVVFGLILVILLMMRLSVVKKLLRKRGGG